jgi:death-on-curing protein
VEILKVQDVLLLHNMAVDASGGSHGLRDLGLLESAVERVNATYGGEDLYLTLFLKAGALMHSLLRNHAFVDGNKRTSVFSAMTFLELNGYVFTIEQDELVKFALRVENDRLPVEEIASWLEEHSQKRAR